MEGVPRRIRRGLIEAPRDGERVRSRRSFPGEFAGASLKQALIAGGHPMATKAFPGEFAGASLKLWRLPALPCAATGVPRRIRRGLIEAGRLQGQAGRGRQGVPRRIRRGLIEALKVAASRRRYRPFPGEFAGASLKLSSTQELSQYSPAPFPGEFAGASLKRSFVGALARGRATFPGEFAGASLKPPPHGRPSPPARRVPRRIRRGLIEAPPSRAGRVAWRLRSPANSPGPH